MATTKTEVVRLNGSAINWRKPPKATERVKWSKKDLYGRDVTGSLRAIAHLNRLNILSVARFGTEIQVIQPPYNTGVAASAGTHDYDFCMDLCIPGVDWHEQQRFFRRNGFACWYRHPPAFGNHIHGFCLPPAEGHIVSDNFQTAGFKVGKYVDGGYSLYGKRVASSQIDDYYSHAFGLSGEHTPGSDKSWYPADINKTIFNLDRYIYNRAVKQAVKSVVTRAKKLFGK